MPETPNNQHSDKDMNVKQKAHNVGVVVGRFQVHELHEAHKELIDSVIAAHPKVMIVLGLSPLRGTTSNPLDFNPRKQMLMEVYPPKDFPNLSIHYIKDMASDEDWSKKLDGLIHENLAPNDTAVLYGSRDSFLTAYKGHFETRELVATRFVSGTETRAKLAAAPQSSPLFRAGAIWATHQRYPAAIPTVDIVVYDDKEGSILLARKPNEQLYRFIGGFVSPNDDSYEAAAKRELYEETAGGLSVGDLTYIGSKKIDDWRYRGETDKIITHFYLAHRLFGMARADDDIAEVRWFPLANFLQKQETIKTDTGTQTITPLPWSIVPEHIPLMEMLVEWARKTNTSAKT
jgi:bifunctional NMN adenylyltransferase/nudix hydrolase